MTVAHDRRHSGNDVKPTTTHADEGCREGVVFRSESDEQPSLKMLEIPPETLFDLQQTLLSGYGLEANLSSAVPNTLTSLPTSQLTSEKLLPQEVTLMTTYMCVVLVLSVVSNGTLACVFYRKRQLLTVSNYFVLNLACCQLGLSFLVLPLSVASVVHGKWAWSDTWCRGQSYLLVVLVVALHYTLLAISMDRNFAIVNSLRYPYVFTHTLGSSIVAGTWIAGLAIGLPPLAGWGSFRYDGRQFLCSVDWGADRAYSLFLLVLVFFLPLLLHFWCYASIFRAALRHARRCRKVLPSPTTTQGSVSRAGSRMMMMECKAVKTVLLIAAAYFICWALFVVLAVLRCWQVPVPLSLGLTSTALLFLSCVVNPLIYGFMNRLTRFEIWKLWRRTCQRLCRRPPPSFVDSEDALSSAWTSSLPSTPRPTTAIWVTPSQRTRPCNRSLTRPVRPVEEMVTIQEETEVEEKEEEKEEVDDAIDDVNKGNVTEDKDRYIEGRILNDRNFDEDKRADIKRCVLNER
ncbi:visual pigment-like receptor peropsin [Babylonia areolata]|uniref:visual pigment-like receptor peropsin n=1 Tax=Babylonia areolata TaxID=304850 RepID=UPI003FD25AB1